MMQPQRCLRQSLGCFSRHILTHTRSYATIDCDLLTSASISLLTPLSWALHRAPEATVGPVTACELPTILTQGLYLVHPALDEKPWIKCCIAVISTTYTTTIHIVTCMSDCRRELDW
jgi:hypothetical protein